MEIQDKIMQMKHQLEVRATLLEDIKANGEDTWLDNRDYLKRWLRETGCCFRWRDESLLVAYLKDEDLPTDWGEPPRFPTHVENALENGVVLPEEDLEEKDLDDLEGLEEEEEEERRRRVIRALIKIQ